MNLKKLGIIIQREYLNKVKKKSFLLTTFGVPILFINAAYPGLPYPLVALNDSRMAFRATQYLVDRGHRKIGGIFKADDGQGRLRYQGYAECMRTIGRGVDERSVFWIDTVAMQEMEKFAICL